MGKESTAAPPKNCVNCPSKADCKANEKGLFTTRIRQEYLDTVKSIRKTDLGKKIYAQRKETIERVFADAKEKHAMRLHITEAWPPSPDGSGLNLLP